MFDSDHELNIIIVYLFIYLFVYLFICLFQRISIPKANSNDSKSHHGNPQQEKQKFTFSLSSNEEANGPQGSFECLQSIKVTR